MVQVNVDKSKAVKIVTRLGESFNLNIIVRNRDGSDYDFTNHTVTFELFIGPSHRTAEVVFSDASGLTLTNGLIALEKTAAQMAAFRLDKYRPYLWVTFPNGHKKLWFNGEFVVNKESYDAPETEDIELIIESVSDTIFLTVQGGRNWNDDEVWDDLQRWNE